MSSNAHSPFTSPAYALVLLAFAHSLEAQTLAQKATLNPAPTIDAAVVVRDLVLLVADRMELNERLARYRWNKRPEEEKFDAAINAANVQITKESGVEQELAESYVKSLVAAGKEYQSLRFSLWGKEGVYEFDDIEDLPVLKAHLDKNLKDQLEKLKILFPNLCSRSMVDEINHTTSSVFVRRDIDTGLLKIIFEPLNRCVR